MNKVTIFIALLLLLLLFGCSGSPVKTTSRDNGNVPELKDSGEIEDRTHFRWYPNGQKAEEIEFKNGLKNGSYTSWYENGRIKLKCFFNNDELDGEVESWFETGRKRFLVNFNQGRRNGQWIRYHEKRDRIVATMNYTEDKLNGVLSIAYEQGNGNGFGRSYAINSVFENGVLAESFSFSHTNIYGYTTAISGKISEKGDVTVTSQKNITLEKEGSLRVNHDGFSDSYLNLQKFFISEINQNVIPKYSLEFCDDSENIWPCQFPENRI